MSQTLIFRFLNFTTPFCVWSPYLMFFYSIFKSKFKTDMIKKNIPLICLICWMFVATFWSIHLSVHESLTASMKYILKFCLFIMLLSLYEKQTDNRLSNLWTFYLIAFLSIVFLIKFFGFLVMSEGVNQFFQRKLQKEILTSVVLSNLIALIALENIIEKPKWYVLRSLILIMYLLFMSIQRMPIVILFIGLAFMYLEHRKKIPFYYSFLFLLVPLVFMGSPLLAKFQKGFHELQTIEQMNTSTTSTASMQIRYKLFERSMRLIYKKPIIGHGPGSHQKLIPVFFNQGDTKKLYYNGIYYLKHTHMLYTCITVQYGLIGLFLFMWWIMSLFNMAKSLESNSRCRVLTAIIAILVIGIFDEPIYDTQFGFLMMSWLAYVIVTGRPKVLPFSK
ncbi:MAG: hypothetical protein CMF41_00615 [Legionellales bacterium]|nr:hypothetical protein [Legionellales bacterium]OUX66358.1 MAG: hypothetical protein CBE41_00395 [Gammaproteobacteria bacterium TMED281]